MGNAENWPKIKDITIIGKTNLGQHSRSNRKFLSTAKAKFENVGNKFKICFLNSKVYGRVQSCYLWNEIANEYDLY